jgi:hypothetical protein
MGFWLVAFTNQSKYVTSVNLGDLKQNIQAPLHLDDGVQVSYKRLLYNVSDGLFSTRLKIVPLVGIYWFPLCNLIVYFRSSLAPKSETGEIQPHENPAY